MEATPLSDSVDKQHPLFLEEIPEKIATMVSCWKQLSYEDWCSEAVETIFLHVLELAEACDLYQLQALSEPLISLELYLSSFIDSDEPRPNVAQVKAVNELMESLLPAWESVEFPDDLEVDSAQPGSMIYYLRSGQDTLPELVPHLENLGTSVLTFLHPDDLQAELRRYPPAVLIFDTLLLSSINRILDEIERLKRDEGIHIPVVCLSHSADLEIRLKAMRSGAEAFFAPPFDIDQLGEQIVTLTATEEKKPIRVLVVDDDPGQADFAASVLQRADMKTHIVTKPLKIMQALDEFKPDLILMDLYMPDANGVELTSVIRTHSDFISTPIVFLSGEQNTDKQLDALSMGGDDFIAKPIRPRHLISMVTNRINRTKEIQERRTKRVVSHPIQQPEAETVVEETPVSSLHTRSHCFEYLETLATTESDTSHLGAFVHLEFSNFDEIKDTISRKDSDHLLGRIGQLISEQISTDDCVTRLGDSVFALVLERPDKASIEELLQTLLNGIQQERFLFDGIRIRPICCIGVCLFDEGLNDTSEIVKRSCQASSAAQTAGGNLIHFYTPDDGLTEPKPGTKRLKEDLEEALEQESFHIVSRSFICKQGINYEIKHLALRLSTDDGALLNESEFLPEARKDGLVEDIDRLMLRHALTMLDYQRHRGKSADILVYQAVESLNDKKRLAWLREQLRSRQLVGTGLIIGFNLSEVGGDLAWAKQYFQTLQSMGIAVALVRFKPNSSALKVLRFLGADYVIISKQYLDADAKTVANFMKRVHDFNAKVILPHVDSARISPTQWADAVDYCQKGAEKRQS